MAVMSLLMTEQNGSVIWGRFHISATFVSENYSLDKTEDKKHFHVLRKPQSLPLQSFP